MNYFLRPHHILCLHFYVSVGYSKEFVSNMDYLYYNLKDDDTILLINDKDLLCKKCPNLCNNICNCYDKVNRYDDIVYKIFANHCDLNKPIIYKKLKEIIIEEVIKKKKFSYICKDCEWHNLCQSVLSQKNY